MRGPGQKRAASRATRGSAASAGTAWSAQLRGVGQVDDERIERGSFLGREDPGDRRRVEGVGSQPVDRLGREGDEPARPDEGGRLADRAPGRSRRTRGAPAARRERAAAPLHRADRPSSRVTAGGGIGGGVRRGGTGARPPAGPPARVAAREPGRLPDRAEEARAPPGGRLPHRAYRPIVQRSVAVQEDGAHQRIAQRPRPRRP